MVEGKGFFFFFRKRACERNCVFVGPPNNFTVNVFSIYYTPVPLRLVKSIALGNYEGLACSGNERQKNVNPYQS
jgi:hypothetical protein